MSERSMWMCLIKPKETISTVKFLMDQKKEIVGEPDENGVWKWCDGVDYDHAVTYNNKFDNFPKQLEKDQYYLVFLIKNSAWVLETIEIIETGATPDKEILLSGNYTVFIPS